MIFTFIFLLLLCVVVLKSEGMALLTMNPFLHENGCIQIPVSQPVPGLIIKKDEYSGNYW